MSDLLRSVAFVELDRPGRYGKQLVSHLGRKFGGGWSPDEGRGWIDLDGRYAAIRALDAGLEIAVDAYANELSRLEEILEGHLIRFVRDSNLEVAWKRGDGA